MQQWHCAQCPKHHRHYAFGGSKTVDWYEAPVRVPPPAPPAFCLGPGYVGAGVLGDACFTDVMPLWAGVVVAVEWPEGRPFSESRGYSFGGEGGWSCFAGLLCASAEGRFHTPSPAALGLASYPMLFSM